MTVVDGNLATPEERALAEAYLNFLYTPEAQALVFKHYYRGWDSSLAAPEDVARFPDLDLVTIADFGGWAKVQPEHFGDGGCSTRSMCAMMRPLVHRSPIPGLGLSAGITLTMLSIIVILPLGALLLKGATFGIGNVWDVVNRDRVWAALWLSFRLSFFAALFNLVFGTILAWVLVRYRFPGRRVLDAAVDLPFALPTAVAGIALTALYAPNGAFGSVLMDWGIKVAYTPAGIFVRAGLCRPSLRRPHRPACRRGNRTRGRRGQRHAGASRLYTIRRVILPMLLPAMLTGFALALARAVGNTGRSSSSRGTSRSCRKSRRF